MHRAPHTPCTTRIVHPVPCTTRTVHPAPHAPCTTRAVHHTHRAPHAPCTTRTEVHISVGQATSKTVAGIVSTHAISHEMPGMPFRPIAVYSPCTVFIATEIWWAYHRHTISLPCRRQREHRVVKSAIDELSAKKKQFLMEYFTRLH